MITPTILNDFGVSLRAKEQRVQEWRLYGKKEYFAENSNAKANILNDQFTSTLMSHITKQN
jgi:hypothetical protein